MMANSYPSGDDRLLIDKYLDQTLDPDGLKLLNHRLEEDKELRKFFIAYSSLETNLTLFVRANKSLKTSIERVEIRPTKKDVLLVREWIPGSRASWLGWIAAALACLALFVTWASNRVEPGPVAWIVDAQNCRWVNRSSDSGKIEIGKSVEIESGLLELGFDCGATAIVEGPARFTVLGEYRMQMDAGRLAVRMQKGDSGFQVVSPSGEIVDLGTEFGVVVNANGDTEVVVYEGEVIAQSNSQNQKVNLNENESAVLTSNGLSTGVNSEPKIVRKIELPPVWLPQSFVTDFSAKDSDRSGGIKDKNGIPIGLASRLSGTGANLQAHDLNLAIDRDSGKLKVMTTRNDINRQRNLENGEYFGIDLKELGFTGNQDFQVKARFSKTPLLIGGFGQFGIYVGDSSDHCIRGGLIKWGNEAENNSLFLVNNSDGLDRDSNKVGYFYPGSDIEVLFSRKDGRYSLKVINQSLGNSNTLEIKHPEFLDDVENMQVGIFVANPFSDEHATVEVDYFSATVWVEKEFAK